MTVQTRVVPPKDLIEVAIRSAMHGFQNLDTLADVVGRIVDTEAWKHASLQRRGDLGPYRDFWDWAEWKLPDGMETSKDKLLAMLEAFPEVKRKVLGLAPAATTHGGDRKGEGSRLATNLDKPAGPTAEGILARLKRDHPQIAQAFIEGEYPSAASAGRAAGISWLQTKSPLEKAQAAFRRLPKGDRDAFKDWLEVEGA